MTQGVSSDIFTDGVGTELVEESRGYFLVWVVFIVGCTVGKGVVVVCLLWVHIGTDLL